MIKIVSAHEPVAIETVVALIYGDPGAGKTSLGCSAKPALLADFDRGSYRSAFRGDHVDINTWSDIESMTEADLKPYGTFIVDTVGRALDVMALSIIAENPKMRAGKGQLSLQGWGVLKSGFASWMRLLRSYGKDVVLLAHGLEQKRGDDTVYRPDIQGGSYNEVFKVADAVGYLHMVGKKRVLGWDPQDTWVGKNPAQLEEIEIPNLALEPEVLGEILARVKASLGAISEESRVILDQVEVWREEVEGAADPGTLTDLANEIKVREDLDEPARRQLAALMGARAKKLGWLWRDGVCVDPKASEAPEAKPEAKSPESETEVASEETGTPEQTDLAGEATAKPRGRNSKS